MGTEAARSPLLATMALTAVAVCSTVLGLAAPSAHATFPGLNGKIAFHSNRDGNFEIYSMDGDGSDQTRLTTSSADDLSPTWSADGTKLAFTSFRHGNFEIYTMNADGTGQTRITNDAAADVAPAWSPDGTKIVFGSLRDGNGEIYTMNSNGTGVARITNNPAVEGQANWSPDGTKLAFTTNRDGGWEIYTMNANGTGQTRLTGDEWEKLEPSWSPDGANIVFHSEYSATTSEIEYCLSTGGCGGAFSNLYFGDLEKEPTYSPDNAQAAFALKLHGTNDWEIVSVVNNGTTSAVTPLTTNSAADQAPDWQPVARNYARPQSATPIKVPLVPAYKQCTTATRNAKHKGVLSTYSCNPPSAASSYLTVGTPDFNGAVANAVGNVTLKVFCNGGAVGEGPPCSTTAGDQLDGNITISQTDVRCQGASGSCPNGALSDYVGNLRFELLARITDRNSTGATGAATLQDVPLSFNFTCTTTPATTVGSTCSTTTSIDAVLGGTSGITEGKRSIWDLDDISVYDGGADGVASTTGDNTLFVSDGLFFP